MKLEPRILLQLFLNFSDFEPQYSCKLYFYKKERSIYRKSMIKSNGTK